MHPWTKSALFAVFGLTWVAPAAMAADLGGNCCADLEERVAELEATSARKGNRKVSLEISGHVNQGLLYWNDGGEDNTYLVTNDNSRSRFGFRGKAKITGDWEAGYRLEIGVRSVNSKRFDQDDDDVADSSGMDIRDAHWYIKSKTYGAMYMGLGTTASNGITELNLSQTAQFMKYSDVEDSGLGLRLRSSDNGNLSAVTWRRLLGDGGDQPGEGERAIDNVRYESPVWNGFVAGASWGRDDMWDMTLRYTGDAAGFKYTAGIGYGEVLDNIQTQSVCAAAPAGAGADGSDARCHQFGGSFSFIHEATGLFAAAGAGIKTDDILTKTARFQGTGADDEQTFWAVQAGVEKKYNELGATTVYGEYYSYDGGANQRRSIDGVDGGVADALNQFAAGGDSAIWSTGLEAYGAGIAQGLDKAAMILYLSYRHYEAEMQVRQIAGGVASGAIASVPLEDLDVVLAGAQIKF